MTTAPIQLESRPTPGGLHAEIDAASPRDVHPRRRGIIVLLLTAAALQIPSLFNPFFIDDYVYLETVHALDWQKVGDIFTTSTMGAEASGVWWTPTGALPFYRPIGEMVFAADYALWGLQPFGYHLTNLALHLACIFLVWRLALRLFERPAWALWAAVVFALHPIHTEALVWISGRFDLLVCACVLASVLCYLRWRRTGDRAGRWLFWSLTWFVLGLGCKETALILPAALAAGEVLRWTRNSAPYRTMRLVVAATTFGAVSLAYLAIRFALFGGLGTLPPPYGVDLSSPTAAAGIIAWNLAQYLMDFTLMIQVDAIYGAAFWWSHPALTAALLALSTALVTAAATLAWRSRAFRLGVVWLCLFTAPALLAMPGERNVYLASVGLSLAIAAAFAGIAQRWGARPAMRAWPRRLAVAVVGLWAVSTVVELGVMWAIAASGEKLLRDLEASMPDPPPGTRVFVVNQCPLLAVGFDQALRLRYDRPDLAGCGLTLAPTIVASSKDTIVPTGRRSIRIQRQDGVFFESFVEKFHLFSAPVGGLSASAERMSLELIDAPTTYDGLTALEFRLPMPLDDPRLRLFVWNNERISGPRDLIKLMEWTALEPWEQAKTIRVDLRGSDGRAFDAPGS
ncbi:MAG: ArnT family glycosyltransferase [Phycisphaerae bacterium]